MNYSDPSGRVPSFHGTPKPGDDGDFEGGRYDWENPNGSIAMMEVNGLLPEKYMDEYWSVKEKVSEDQNGGSGAGYAGTPQADSQSGPKVVFDSVELLDDPDAGRPKGPLGVPRSVNPIRAATRHEFNPNEFTLDVDDPRVETGGLMAIRVKFHVIGGDWSRVDIVTTENESRRWDIAERRQLDRNSFIIGVNVYDKEARINPISVKVHVTWKESMWENGKLNDYRDKTVTAAIRLLVGPKDR
jgi:hypothetical protein